jgi:hypothetical protein
MLTCPWCGREGIERPLVYAGSSRGLNEGLASCKICGAKEIDPVEPGHRAGWRRGRMLVLRTEATLHDDASVREKLTVMNPWDALWDDERTPREFDWGEEVTKAMILGKRYRIVLTIEEIPT